MHKNNSNQDEERENMMLCNRSTIEKEREKSHRCQAVNDFANADDNTLRE